MALWSFGDLRKSCPGYFSEGSKSAKILKSKLFFRRCGALVEFFKIRKSRRKKLSISKFDQ